MSEKEFKVGDVVYLNSGSPKLTVKSIKKSVKNGVLFPVLTAPEGLDIWNEKDTNAIAIRKEQEKLLRNIASGKMLGVLLPFGWKLKLEPPSSVEQLNEEDVEIEVKVSWISSSGGYVNTEKFFAPQLSTSPIEVQKKKMFGMFGMEEKSDS